MPAGLGVGGALGEERGDAADDGWILSLAGPHADRAAAEARSEVDCGLHLIELPLALLLGARGEAGAGVAPEVGDAHARRLSSGFERRGVDLGRIGREVWRPPPQVDLAEPTIGQHRHRLGRGPLAERVGARRDPRQVHGLLLSPLTHLRGAAALAGRPQPSPAKAEPCPHLLGPRRDARSARSESGVEPPHSIEDLVPLAGARLSGPLECGGSTPLWLPAKRASRVASPFSMGSLEHLGKPQPAGRGSRALPRSG